MKRNIGVALVFALLLVSCTAEKINLSPISDNVSNDLYPSSDADVKTEAIAYQSEITNLIASFPKFKNKNLNKEVHNLKISLNNYVIAYSKKDQKAMKNAYKEYVSSYKKIQILRKHLNKDQDNILNRYMVRIKTNINLLESIN
ncbi:hypothetical protein [Halpernia sp.]|uniref:hypothetical protein n=1 Tax=Halpernia sp. TaxID=2782209 RepID=UPI003A946819